MLKKSAFTLTELAIVLVVILVFMCILTPFINNIKNKAKIVDCEGNLQNIGQGLNLYALEHSGKFPDTLSDLLKGGYVENAKVFDCPSSASLGTTDNPDYEYTPGCTILTDSKTVIVSDKPGNHKNGKYVLYITGDIIWENTG